MHAEKGKPGQYVGKVDANSPAELAGLREGDRIIEVNGTDIGSETHKQVVERIKTVPNETTLLVIDPHSFHVTKNGSSVVVATSPVTKKGKDVTVEQQMPSIVEKSMNNNNRHDVTDSTADKNMKTGTKDNSAVSTENNNTKVTNETVMISSTNNETAVDTTKTETGNHHVNNHSKLTTTTTTQKQATVTSAATTTNVAENNNHDKNHENNSSTANGKQHSTEPSETKTQTTNGTVLNLNMTATDFRAKLLAKKKHDPKNDSIDLRKKYDIIEKM